MIVDLDVRPGIDKGGNLCPPPLAVDLQALEEEAVLVGGPHSNVIYLVRDWGDSTHYAPSSGQVGGNVWRGGAEAAQEVVVWMLGHGPQGLGVVRGRFNDTQCVGLSGQCRGGGWWGGAMAVKDTIGRMMGSG